MACSPLTVKWCFGSICHIDVQDRRRIQARNVHEVGSKHSAILNARRYIPENRSLHSNHYENLTSYISNYLLSISRSMWDNFMIISSHSPVRTQKITNNPSQCKPVSEPRFEPRISRMWSMKSTRDDQWKCTSKMYSCNYLNFWTYKNFAVF
jgi:hypothetical protein